MIDTELSSSLSSPLSSSSSWSPPSSSPSFVVVVTTVIVAVVRCRSSSFVVVGAVRRRRRRSHRSLRLSATDGRLTVSVTSIEFQRHVRSCVRSFVHSQRVEEPERANTNKHKPNQSNANKLDFSNSRFFDEKKRKKQSNPFLDVSIFRRFWSVVVRRYGCSVVWLVGWWCCTKPASCHLRGTSHKRRDG